MFAEEPALSICLISAIILIWNFLSLFIIFTKHSVFSSTYENENSDDRLEERNVILDMSKVFDKVWHNMVYWLKQILSNIDWKKSCSQRSNFLYKRGFGISTRPILGPLLLLIYTDDLSKGLPLIFNFLLMSTKGHKCLNKPAAFSCTLFKVCMTF